MSMWAAYPGLRWSDAPATGRGRCRDYANRAFPIHGDVMQTTDARRIARLVVELRARLAGESYHVVGNVLVNLASEMLEQGAREIVPPTSSSPSSLSMSGRRSRAGQRARWRTESHGQRKILMLGVFVTGVVTGVFLDIYVRTPC